MLGVGTIYIYIKFDKELGYDLGTQSHQACHHPQSLHHKILHKHHHHRSLIEPQLKKLTRMTSLRWRQLKISNIPQKDLAWAV
jgi:hypothetical protein